MIQELSIADCRFPIKKREENTIDNRQSAIDNF